MDRLHQRPPAARQRHQRQPLQQRRQPLHVVLALRRHRSSSGAASPPAGRSRETPFRPRSTPSPCISSQRVNRRVLPSSTSRASAGAPSSSHSVVRACAVETMRVAPSSARRSANPSVRSAIFASASSFCAGGATAASAASRAPPAAPRHPAPATPAPTRARSARWRRRHELRARRLLTAVDAETSRGDAMDASRGREFVRAGQASRDPSALASCDEAGYWFGASSRHRGCAVWAGGLILAFSSPSGGSPPWRLAGHE